MGILIITRYFNLTAMSNITPKRFKCKCGCGQFVAPNYKREQVPSKYYGLMVDGKITGIRGYGYANNGHFATLRCGFWWAVKKFGNNINDW